VLDAVKLRDVMLSLAIDYSCWVDAEFDYLRSPQETEARRWMSPDQWFSFAEHYPHLTVLVAKRLLSLETAVAQEHSSSHGVGSHMSPQRALLSPAERQRHVCERLYMGLASIPTAKDRSLDLYEYFNFL
jgi:hypothetical protein